jgi:hypothetical protein
MLLWEDSRKRKLDTEAADPPQAVCQANFHSVVGGFTEATACRGSAADGCQAEC